MFVYANLDENQVQRVKTVEAATGLRLIAMTDVQLDPAPIDAAVLTQIKEAEDELGVCLYAVR